ncbi:MAG: MFS transporter [Synechococcaceae cyanobacterium]|nr:MFS transporter [Synechococcaceae cyanobacterium]
MWWIQFPLSLRRLAAIRLLAAIGAGGVLYLTPMVFHREAFSASSVTEGLALAALAGTVGRFVSGALLDRGLNCSRPVLAAAGLGLAADGLLSAAQGFGGYLLGQLLMGVSMGLYWPAIELAVPLACPPLSSARAFALVRSADALGVASGALIGALLAAAGRLRGIYAVDMLMLALLAGTLLWRPLPDPHPVGRPRQALSWRRWLPPLLPLLALSVVATAMPALLQSALPLDLVRGGLARGPLPEGLGALLIGLQLALLLVLQWPVGRALARRPVRQGLALSLACFIVGSLLLAASALFGGGVVLVIAAQLPLALGEAAFLPTSTEAVVELSPLAHRGLAMALFSQCFALSAATAPLLAGRLLDAQNHGAGLWCLMALACALALPLAGSIEGIQRRTLLEVLSGGSDAAAPEILYRFPVEPSGGTPLPGDRGEQGDGAGGAGLSGPD